MWPVLFEAQRSRGSGCSYPAANIFRQVAASKSLTVPYGAVSLRDIGLPASNLDSTNDLLHFNSTLPSPEPLRATGRITAGHDAWIRHMTHGSHGSAGHRVRHGGPWRAQRAMAGHVSHGESRSADVGLVESRRARGVSLYSQRGTAYSIWAAVSTGTSPSNTVPVRSHPAQDPREAARVTGADRRYAAALFVGSIFPAS